MRPEERFSPARGSGGDGGEGREGMGKGGRRENGRRRRGGLPLSAPEGAGPRVEAKGRCAENIR